jgi:hypothetical protein
MDKIVDVLPIGSAQVLDWPAFWLIKAQNLFDFLTGSTGFVWVVIVVGAAIIGILIIRR